MRQAAPTRKILSDLRSATRASYEAKNWPDAAEHAQRGLATGAAKNEIMFYAKVLCTSLTALGRPDHSRRALDAVLQSFPTFEQDLADDERSLVFAMFAAIAAGNEPLVDRLYRKILQPTHPIERVVISDARGLEGFSTPDVEILHTLPPSHIIVDERAQGSERWEYDTDPTIIARVANGFLLSGWDHVVTQDRVVIANSGYNALDSRRGNYLSAYDQDLGRVAHAWTDDVTTVDADVLFMSTPERFHYGHWLVDFLPRLQALDVVNDPALLIAVPTELPRKHRDLLKCFGITEDRIFNCDFGKRYQFRKIIVAQVGSHFHPDPRSFQFLRNHLGRKASRAPSTPVRYFLERGAGTRRPANGDAFNAVLREFGFRCIDLSKLPLAEEHEFLANADIIIGAQGTELLSVLGAPAGADLIELIWDTAQDPFVGPICSFLKIRHQFLVCPEAPHAVKKIYHKDRDLIVDCAELRRRLEAVIARKGS